MKKIRTAIVLLFLSFALLSIDSQAQALKLENHFANCIVDGTYLFTFNTSIVLTPDFTGVIKMTFQLPAGHYLIPESGKKKIVVTRVGNWFIGDLHNVDGILSSDGTLSFVISKE